MKTFAAAAEAGSFTAAAERLGCSKKLVSKYIGQLENRLGVRLFHRTTRRLSLTEAGQSYYPRCVKLLEELDALESGLKAERGALSGNLRITAPVHFGALYVRALVQGFQQQHPEVYFDLRLTDSYLDLADSGFDLAIRIGRPEASSYRARRLSVTRPWAVASPAYLGAAPPLRRPEDLQAHRCIIDTNMRSGGNWPFEVEGQTVSVPVRGPASVNSPEALRGFVLGGAGVGLIPDYVVARDVAEGRLMRVLADYPSPEMVVQALYLDARYMPLRLRRFIDYMAAAFARRAGWHELLESEAPGSSGN